MVMLQTTMTLDYDCRAGAVESVAPCTSMALSKFFPQAVQWELQNLMRSCSGERSFHDCGAGAVESVAAWPSQLLLQPELAGTWAALPIKCCDFKIASSFHDTP